MPKLGVSPALERAPRQQGARSADTQTPTVTGVMDAKGGCRHSIGQGWVSGVSGGQSREAQDP